MTNQKFKIFLNPNLDTITISSLKHVLNSIVFYNVMVKKWKKEKKCLKNRYFGFLIGYLFSQY